MTQIYGITDPDDAAAINALRPDHVGLVLDEDEEETWDSVGAGIMTEIRAQLTEVRVVALSFATAEDAILRTIDAVQPQIVHLVRAADRMTARSLEVLRERIAPIEVMVTVPVRDRAAIATASALQPVCDWLLLDSAHSVSGVVGATGEVHDWTISREIVRSTEVPVFLAGGLGPENVVRAIAEVGPAGVDSETRTSRIDDRRRKDLGAVREFVDLARSSAQ